MREFEALVAEHLAPARRELERQAILIEQLRTGKIDFRSPDQTIRITQTCAGEITDVEIASGAFGKHDERSFANLMKQTLQASREAGQQVAEQMTDRILRGREAPHGR